jgi:nucleoside-diphosphate-sugar epimerase
MRVLVTGASGFVGSHLLPELRRHGHDVTAFVRRPEVIPGLLDAGMAVARGDISDLASMEKASAGQEAVVHLAAMVAAYPKDWDSYVPTALTGTVNVMEAAQRARVQRVLHMSSCVVYEEPPAGSAVTEESPLERRVEPWNHYLRQKLQTETLIRERAVDVDLTIVRPPTIIGPGDRGLVPLLQAIGRSPLGALAGDDGNHFPLVAVPDLVSGLVAALECSGAVGRVYNMASNRLVTKAEISFELSAAGISLARHRPFEQATMVAMRGACRLVRSRGDRPGGRPLTRAHRAAIAGLEARSRRRAQPDLIVDSTAARRDLGFNGDSDPIAALRAAIAWHLSAPGLAHE